ncbi:hypothetical protein MCOR25_008882 [Pyricularia grisea]|nr:hypothetical protein MCOR25_008882 [Pyricularia grisea]
MLGDDSTISPKAVTIPTPTPTPTLGPLTPVLPPPVESENNGPENSKEEPNLVAVIALPVIAAILLGVVFVLIYMFKKRKEDQGVGLEAGGGGALGKPQLSSDGILQVEPQELLADLPEPN